MCSGRRPGERAVYQITVEGRIDESWSSWFEEVTIAVQRAGDGTSITTLTGLVADQAALRGILTKVWDLNLTVISVSRMAADPQK